MWEMSDCTLLMISVRAETGGKPAVIAVSKP
jgi:hypothetical protein